MQCLEGHERKGYESMTTETDTDVGDTSLELVMFGPGSYAWDVGDSDCWRGWSATMEGGEPGPLTLFTTGP